MTYNYKLKELIQEIYVDGVQSQAGIRPFEEECRRCADECRQMAGAGV